MRALPVPMVSASYRPPAAQEASTGAAGRPRPIALISMRVTPGAGAACALLQAQGGLVGVGEAQAGLGGGFGEVNRHPLQHQAAFGRQEQAQPIHLQGLLPGLWSRPRR